MTLDELEFDFGEFVVLPTEGSVCLAELTSVVPMLNVQQTKQVRLKGGLKHCL